MELQSVRTSLASIEGSFAYLKPLDRYQHEKPYFYSGPLAPEEEAQRTNLAYDEHTMVVKDIRGHEQELDVEKHGFAFVSHHSGIDLSSRSEEGTHAYINETCSLMQDILDAERVICYDFRVRLMQVQT